MNHNNASNSAPQLLPKTTTPTTTTTTTIMGAPLLTIPTEILFEIAKSVPLNSTIALLMTCRAMNRLRAFILSQYKNDMLLFAAEHNCLDLVQLALSAGADITFAGQPAQEAPLHRAACRGYTAIVRELLGHNPPLEHRGRSDRTALFVATICGHQEVVDLLPTAGADPDARDEDTLLITAIRSNLTPTAIAFIHQMDQTALDLAIELERLSIVQLMFARGIASTVVPPLSLAIEIGLDYVKLCVEHGGLGRYTLNDLVSDAFTMDTSILEYLLSQF